MPAVVTVIEEVLSPVLHNKIPVAVVDNVEVPQLFTTVTTGGRLNDTVINIDVFAVPQLLVTL